MHAVRLTNLNISSALPEEYVLLAGVDCALKTVADMQLF
jgi:hypothetical protein